MNAALKRTVVLELTEDEADLLEEVLRLSPGSETMARLADMIAEVLD